MTHPKIGLIGAGKVGTALGAYFQKNGFAVAGYVSRSVASAQRAAKLNSVAVFQDVCTLLKDCDILFITTPDDEIHKVWDALKSCELKDKIICHTSGSLSSKVFDGIGVLGGYGYSFHPMYAFSDPMGRAPGLENSFFTIEGDEGRLEEVKGFVARMGNRTFVLDSSSKALYHAANVVSANLMLALLKVGADCMEGCGIEQRNAIQALMPMVQGNLNSIAQKGFIDSLTGPVERNDVGTIQKHLEVLPQECQGIYRELSGVLTEVAQQKHPHRDYASLKELLS